MPSQQLPLLTDTPPKKPRRKAKRLPFAQWVLAHKDEYPKAAECALEYLAKKAQQQHGQQS